MGACQSYHNILVLGMPQSGKTSILQTLEDLACHSRIVNTAPPPPTMQFFRKRIQHGSHALLLCELGASDDALASWPHYYDNVHAIIYVLDVSKRDLLAPFPSYPNDKEMNRLLDALGYVENGRRPLQDVPVVILMNKFDVFSKNPKLKQALSQFQMWVVRYYKQYFSEHSEKENTFGTWYTVGANGAGCLEPLDWLCEVFVSRAPFHIKVVQSVTG